MNTENILLNYWFAGFNINTLLVLGGFVFINCILYIVYRKNYLTKTNKECYFFCLFGLLIFCYGLFLYIIYFCLSTTGIAQLCINLGLLLIVGNSYVILHNIDYVQQIIPHYVPRMQLYSLSPDLLLFVRILGIGVGVFLLYTLCLAIFSVNGDNLSPFWGLIYCGGFLFLLCFTLVIFAFFFFKYYKKEKAKLPKNNKNFWELSYAQHRILYFIKKIKIQKKDQIFLYFFAIFQFLASTNVFITGVALFSFRYDDGLCIHLLYLFYLLMLFIGFLPGFRSYILQHYGLYSLRLLGLNPAADPVIKKALYAGTVLIGLGSADAAVSIVVNKAQNLYGFQKPVTSVMFTTFEHLNKAIKWNKFGK